MKKTKILGVIISVKDVTISDLCKYCNMESKEVEKIVNQLIKENKICYS